MLYLSSEKNKKQQEAWFDPFFKKQLNLEFPVAATGHGDLMFPHVEVQGVEVVLEDQLSGFVSLADSSPDAGRDRGLGKAGGQRGAEDENKSEAVHSGGLDGSKARTRLKYFQKIFDFYINQSLNGGGDKTFFKSNVNKFNLPKISVREASKIQVKQHCFYNLSDYVNFQC